MRLWVTRSQPGAERTAEALRAKGHEPVVQPVLIVEPIPAQLDLEGVAALAFTSGHAVAAFARQSPRRDLVCYVTGQGTTTEARAAGFAEVGSAGGDAADLARLILADPPSGPVFWPRAETPAQDLAALLRKGGVQVREVPVYRTSMSRESPPAGLGGVLIHSARGAEAVRGVMPAAEASKLQLFALSAAAAQPLKDLAFTAVAIAPEPTELALVKLIPG
jgi:uroporphyrinogen-III synthase